MKYALIAALAPALAGCGRNDGINGAQLAGGVSDQIPPAQTQGRTEGDDGIPKAAKPPQTQGRTK